MGAGSKIQEGTSRYSNGYEPQPPILKKRETSTPVKCSKCKEVIPMGRDHWKLGKKILLGRDHWKLGKKILLGRDHWKLGKKILCKSCK
jgi:hypothetical protein